MLEEYQFTCPYCWESITMLLDCSVSEQSYVEDCEICCNPIRISYRADSGAVEQFEASELGQ
ncbi:MAG: CPXCG motif-containing cysteine-rich protein [Candidatus Obscuribacterales bacterium]|nr:CPXCG motif-containing cysteine-rich protein [Candidatus Obscuribacterales bacterium]